MSDKKYVRVHYVRKDDSLLAACGKLQPFVRSRDVAQVTCVSCLKSVSPRSLL